MVVGSPGAVISDVLLEDVQLTLVRLTTLPGGYRDLRPSTINCVRHVSDDPVFLDHVSNLTVQGLQVRDLDRVVGFGLSLGFGGWGLRACGGSSQLTSSEAAAACATVAACQS